MEIEILRFPYLVFFVIENSQILADAWESSYAKSFKGIMQEVMENGVNFKSRQISLKGNHYKPVKIVFKTIQDA